MNPDVRAMDLSSISPLRIGGTAAAVLIMSLLASLLLVKRSNRLGLLDMPSAIKLHSTPVPRSGGVAIVLSLTIGSFVSNSIWPAQIQGLALQIVPSLLVFLIGLVDDLMDLKPLVKLAAIAIAAVLVATQLPTLSFLPCILLALLAVVITNAVNLLDGADGLAAGVMLIAMTALGWILWRQCRPELSTLCILTVPAIAGFLIPNLRGRLFMGDCGSLFLGFLAATMLMVLAVGGIRPFLAGLFCLGVPLLDLLFVITRRLYLRTPLLAGDLNHGYNLLTARLGNSKFVLAIYNIVALLFALGGILLFGG